MALPNAYTQLKYIQATGTQYINTGVTATANTTAKYKFSLDEIKTYGPHILSGANWFFPLLRSLSGSTFVAHRGGNNVENTTFTGKVGVDYEVDAFTNDKVTINGVDCGTVTNGSSSSDTTTLYLMTYAGSPSDSNYAMSGKLYYCQIYENGTLIRDFIPAMRTSDSAVGLYDQANGVFYTNAGSGSFTGFLATGKVEGNGASIIDGTSYGMEQGKTLVGGTAYDITEGKTIVNGTAFTIKVHPAIQISSLPVGTSVYVNVNGVQKEFIIVHHGNPDTSIYDTSCNGTWLLMKDIYTTHKFATYGSSSSSGYEYHESSMNTYVNETFFNLIDATQSAAIKTVKIPYIVNYAVKNKANGLSVKTFLLSNREINVSSSSSYITNGYLDGNPLSYFPTRGTRVAYYNGTADEWWTRSLNTGKGGYDNIYVNTAGNAVTSARPDREYGVRPACIVYSETLVNPSDYTIIGL